MSVTLQQIKESLRIVVELAEQHVLSTGPDPVALTEEQRKQADALGYVRSKLMPNITDLLNVVNCIFIDSQDAISGKWNPSIGHSAFKAQQQLLTRVCWAIGVALPIPENQLTTEIEEKSLPPVIVAEIHSDDRNVTVDFDAVTWFEQATSAEIAALVDCDFGGDVAADNVAEFIAAKFPTSPVNNVFNYLNIIRGDAMKKDQCGFEVTVEKISAVRWLQANRPGFIGQLCLTLTRHAILQETLEEIAQS